jgi:CheY-like chemotaxis protein
LTILGHDVRTALDGASALSEAAQFHPDVVLLDIGMPGLSGYDVARQLRDSPLGEHVLIVTLSGWGQDADRAKALAAGADRHLVKPATLVTLRETLTLEHVPAARA